MTLRSLDRALTHATIAVRGRLGAVSYRLEQALARGVAVTHGATLRLGHALGMGRVDEEQLRRCRPAPDAAAPAVPSFFAVVEPAGQAADELVSGYRVLQNGRRVDLATVSWRHDPFGGVSSLERILFHSLDWVQALLSAYVERGDPRYLRAAQSLADRWIRECLWCEEGDDIWSDHATGLRALALGRLWVESCRGDAPDPEFGRRMVAAAERHGVKLSHPALYRPEHNHGVSQAYGLLAIGVLFAGLPEAPRWARTGLEWIEAQLAENMSPEGLHLEHSPYYHFYVWRQLADAERFATRHGLRPSDAFRRGLARCLEAGAHVLKPDGTLVAFGDSARTSAVLADLEDARPGEPAPGFAWIASAGREGSPPAVESVCWPGAGYACLRSGWGTDRPLREELCLPIRLETFSKAHVHRDVLGFELYAFGGDLLVDSGGPYAYGEARRMDFLSTPAHNTVTVDGASQPLGPARVRVHGVSAGVESLCAEHELYPGTRHRRWFVVLPDANVLLVDRLRSDRERTYAHRFHLAPGLIAGSSGSRVDAAPRSGGPAITLEARPGGYGSLQVAPEPEGAYGWSCAGERRLLPHGLVTFESRGTETALCVLLSPRRDGTATSPRVVWHGGEEGVVDLAVAGDDRAIRVRLRIDDDLLPEVLDA